MIHNYNKNLVHLAQELRKNMTEEEHKLWFYFLKRLPFTVNRQKIIGNYIVDFFIASKRTIIEIDGSQHYFDKGKEADKIRDNELRSLGYTVLRYSNRDINYCYDSVCENLANKLNVTVMDLKW